MTPASRRHPPVSAPLGHGIVFAHDFCGSLDVHRSRRRTHRFSPKTTTSVCSTSAFRPRLRRRIGAHWWTAWDGALLLDFGCLPRLALREPNDLLHGGLDFAPYLLDTL